MIKILIADDHPLVREGLRRILAAEPGFNVVGEAADGQQAVEFVLANDVDIVILDVNMPVINGADVCEAIKRDKPRVGVVALTVHDQDEYLFEMIKAGVSAYLLKDTGPDLLVQTIWGVVRGESYISPGLAPRVFDEFSRLSRNQSNPAVRLGLTGREAEVLGLLALGHSNHEISERLLISERTVKNHLTHVFGKLGVPDRTRAALYAVKYRLLGLMAFFPVRLFFLHSWRF